MPALPAKSFILATAGHVDHGKSALVKALTGTDPDRLPEEKSRGITIELGFAELRLESDNTAFRIGIIDVPGHEDFVKNMVAGVGSIDLALLVVAADDGWMPQTEEHLQILEYLGVGRGIVALSKSDLSVSIDESRAAIREKLRGSALAEAPIIPTSVVTKAGLNELLNAIKTLLAELPPPKDVGKPRLPVDRAFSLRGAGTIVTGTLSGGSIKSEQSLRLWPAGIDVRVRSIQTHGQLLIEARPGSRVALNLPEVHPRAARERSEKAAVGRGDVLTLGELGQPGNILDVLFCCSARLGRYGGGTARLKTGSRVRVHHGGGTWAGRVQLADARQLQPGATSLGRVRLEEGRTIFAFAGDRLLIRDWPEQNTLAGAIVLDAHPSLPFLRAMSHPSLRLRSEHPTDPAVLVATEIARAGAIPRDGLLIQSMLDAESINAALEQSARLGQVVIRGKVIIEASFWSRANATAVQMVDAHHASHPELAGLDLSTLRSALLKQVSSATAVDAVIDSLCKNGEFLLANSSLRRSTHGPALPPRLRPAGEKLRAALLARPFEPPSRKELLANDSLCAAALKFLAINGEAVEVGTDVVMSATAFGEAKRLIQAHLSKVGSATVSELKTLLGSSRRIMVPLLEKLDREGFTVREGDRRRLK